MAGVMIQFDPTVFNAGKPLAAFAPHKHKAVWDTTSGIKSAPHIDSSMVVQGHGNGTPNSQTIKIRYGSPSWVDTANEFNKLPYDEMRAALANGVERGIIQVLDSTGSPAAVADIRDGTVA